MCKPARFGVEALASLRGAARKETEVSTPLALAFWRAIERKVGSAPEGIGTEPVVRRSRLTRVAHLDLTSRHDLPVETPWLKPLLRFVQ